MEDVLAIVLIFGGGSLFLLAISPIGQAIADRIRAGTVVPEESLRRVHEAQQALLENLEALRQEVAEVQERLDFAERLLVQQRERSRLPGEVASGLPAADQGNDSRGALPPGWGRRDPAGQPVPDGAAGAGG